MLVDHRREPAVGADKLIVRPLLNDLAAVAEDNHVVGIWQGVQLVCRKDPSLTLQRTADAMFQKVLPDMDVDGGQNII